MLFRAQIPVAVTSLFSPYDPRLLLFFECHATIEGTLCDAGTVLLTEGEENPRSPPECQVFDVLITATGPRPEDVARMAQALLAQSSEDSPNGPGGPLAATSPSQGHAALPQPLSAPIKVLNNVPRSIAAQAVRVFHDLGATAERVPASPTILGEVRGGKLVPFDDGVVGMHRTTLPPLEELKGTYGVRKMRGLVGSSIPGYRDYAFSCKCGRRTRTAVRLLADHSMNPIMLGPATAQVCVHCGTGSLHRSV